MTYDPADKLTLRAEARRRRKQIGTAARRHAAAAVAERFLGHSKLRREVVAGRAFSGYVAIGSELDPSVLLQRLVGNGMQGSLPVTRRRYDVLEFRQWTPGQALVSGPYNIPIPPDTAAVVRPRLLVVPLLAFDVAGHRLGYGAGYYDRTLRSLRRAGPVAAVGVAFSGQRVEKVPVNENDEPLDWVVTDQDVLEVRRT